MQKISNVREVQIHRQNLDTRQIGVRQTRFEVPQIPITAARAPSRRRASEAI
jgi:hypothetical protein